MADITFLTDQLADFSTFAGAVKDTFEAIVALFGDSDEKTGAFEALSSFGGDTPDTDDPEVAEGSFAGSSEGNE